MGRFGSCRWMVVKPGRSPRSNMVPRNHGGRPTVEPYSSNHRFHWKRSSPRMARRPGVRPAPVRLFMTRPGGSKRRETKSNRILRGVSRRFDRGLKVMLAKETRGSSIESRFKANRRSKNGLDCVRSLKYHWYQTIRHHAASAGARWCDSMRCIPWTVGKSSWRRGAGKRTPMRFSNLALSSSRSSLRPSKMPRFFWRCLAGPCRIHFPVPMAVWSRSQVRWSMSRSIAAVNSGSCRSRVASQSGPRTVPISVSTNFVGPMKRLAFSSPHRIGVPFHFWRPARPPWSRLI